MLAEENLEYLSRVSSDDLLPNVSRWATFGGLALLGCCGASIILASLIEYPVTVKAPAVVRPEGELRIVEAMMSGTVSQILVKENQVVNKGDVIAKIDDSNLQTRKNQIVLSIGEQQSEIKLLYAQIDATKVQIQAEYNAMSRAIAQAEAEQRRSIREYEDRQSIANSEVQETAAALALAADEAHRYQELEGLGAISKLQIQEKLQAYKAALARQQRAKVGLNPSTATIDIAKERMAQERARGESTIASLKKSIQSLVTRRVQLENQIRRNRHELAQVLGDIQKSVIRAPESGVMFKLELRNELQVVRPGQAVAQIAPQLAPLVIKARVAAKDISQVKVCNLKNTDNCQSGKAQLRISAYPYPDYGTLKGAVRAVTADTVSTNTSQKSTSAVNINEASSTYYEVTIQPEKLQLEKNGANYPIQVGMEVTADIIAKKETLLTFALRRARLLTDV